MRNVRILNAIGQAAEAVSQRRSTRPLNECPHCDCSLVQPLSWKERPDGRILLELRCPDCRTYMVGSFLAERVRELDRSLTEGRTALRETYEWLVAANMRSMLTSFSAGLERDLIGPDDFRA